MSRFPVIAAVSLLATLAFVPRAFAVDIDDLWKEFRNNEGAFNQKYKGQTLSVTGPVWIIHSEATPASVALRAGASTGVNLGAVYCYTSAAIALKQSKGATVTITGTYAGPGAAGAGININPCTVQ
jgi:hypothetical protein